MRDEIRAQVMLVFEEDFVVVPSLTLRAGEALADHLEPPPYDPIVDQPNDLYLEKYTYWGLGYLDPASWRHYLPRLVDYAFRHQAKCDSMVVDGLLRSLHPPDHVPPRLGSLSVEQEAAMRAFLEEIAFGEDSAHDREDAMLALEEWWLPNALYRSKP